MSLLVHHPGLCSLVVDFGRSASRSLGLPLGGAADRSSLALANSLVGNRPDEAGLEITLSGPTLEAQVPLAGVLLGAPFEITSTRQKIRIGYTFSLTEGEQISIGGCQTQSRAYLCVAGGLRPKLVLGSFSSLEPLREGEILPCSMGQMPRICPRFVWEGQTLPPPHKGKRETGPPFLRIVDGPQGEWFPPKWWKDKGKRAMAHWVVGPSSNRMGIRCQGRPLPVPDQQMVSEPVCPGSVQVTPDGQLILVGVDGQTIGGYPKIAQIIQADWDILGQLRPGDAVRFDQVSLAQAEALTLDYLRERTGWALRLREAARPYLQKKNSPRFQTQGPCPKT